MSETLDIPGKEETLRALSDYFTRFCAGTDFLRRLASENRWDEAHAYRVVAEYIRFLAVAKLSGEAVAPSEAIDKAWHLHLVYTHWYWEELCGRILGKPFHHFPATSSESRKKFSKDAARTLELYGGYFGRYPRDIWGKPSPWRALDRRRLMASLVAMGFGAGLIAIARSKEDPSMGIVIGFSGLIVFLGFCLFLSVVVDWIRGKVRTERPPKGYSPDSPDFGAYPAVDSGVGTEVSWSGDSHGHGHGGHSCGGGHGHSCGSSCGSSCGGAH